MSARRNNRANTRTHQVKTDREALEQASAIQEDTLAALQRAHQQASETHDVGVTTLEELHAHRAQLDKIQQEGDRLDEALTQSEKLQNRLGKWAFAWRSNKVARRQAEEERKQQEELDRKKEARAAQRQAELEEQQAAKESTSSNTVMISPHRKQKSPRKAKAGTSPSKTKIGLTEGIDPNDKHKKEFEQLASTDAEIDQSLDALGSQLDSLLALSKEVGSETNNQSRGISNVSTRIEESKQRQNIVNKRSTRFFSGQKRREHEKQDTLNPAALVRMAQNSL